MFRYSRRWTWLMVALAVFVLAAGAAAALLIWNARSSSTQEVLDPHAVADAAEGILDSTTSIVLEWGKAGLVGDLTNLLIAQQESQVLLSYEIESAQKLTEQAQDLEAEGNRETWEELNNALSSLLKSQLLLQEALEQAGVLLTSLNPLGDADSAYRKGREALISAVNEHNQSVATDPSSLSAARQEAASAIVSLQEAETALQSLQVEGLNLEVAMNTTMALKQTAEKFIAACEKGESGDIEVHNNLAAEVQSELSSSPASIMDSLDIGGWLQSMLEPYMESTMNACEETGTLLEKI